MAKQVTLEAEAVTAWTLQATDDGQNAAIILKLARGTAALSFSPPDFARFAESVVLHAQLIGPTRPNAANGVQVDSISIKPHPDQSSTALLAIDAGTLKYLFASDVNLLLHSCKKFLVQWRESRGRD